MKSYDYSMTKHDAKLHPGEYFLERQEKPDGNWELSSRDNDVDVMRARFIYWKENAPVGCGVRLFAPDCSLVEEHAGVLVGPQVA